MLSVLGSPVSCLQSQVRQPIERDFKAFPLSPDFLAQAQASPSIQPLRPDTGELLWTIPFPPSLLPFYFQPTMTPGLSLP